MSYGLVVDCEDEKWEIGKDLSEHYGITKYEPPIRCQAGDAAPQDPYFEKFTDIESIRNYPDIFQPNELVVLLEKIDGTNCRLGMGMGPDETIIWKAGSHKVPRNNAEPPQGLST